MTRAAYEASPDPRAARETRDAKGIIVLIVLAIMLFAVARAVMWFDDSERVDRFVGMADGMFTTHLIPFEVLGFLLLAALIGALYIANREGIRRA